MGQSSVSLIIPVYNEEKLIAAALTKCLDALKKDFSDFEIILIDDGSRDNSIQILKEFETKFPEIKVFQNYINLNQGISVQRGYAVATKDYILHNGIDLPLNPGSIKELIDCMGDAHVLVVQREIYSGATLWRRITSKCNIAIRKLLFIRLSKGIRDMNYTQIYRKDIVKMVLPLAKSPAFTTPEMVFRARYAKLKVITKYIAFEARTMGKGSLGKLHDILWSVYDMIRFRYLLSLGIKKHGKQTTQYNF